MEGLVAAILRKNYPDVLVPGALLDVPIGWSHVALDCLEAARTLDRRVRVHEIVRTGDLMCVSPGWEGDVDDCPEEVWDQVRRIATDARETSACTCIVDGRPGWAVDTSRGPEVLCEWCQQEWGIRIDPKRRADLKRCFQSKESKEIKDDEN